LRPTFPNRRHLSAGDYLDHYFAELTAAHASINRSQLDAAVVILTGAHQRDATIFCCGNGGSASIASHMVCDHQKGVNCDTALRPRVVSLSSNVEVITAVSNDIGFADVFAFPLRIHGRRGDVLVAVSSSGDSENIVRALTAAAEIGMQTIALTGFDGGRSRKLADASIHVDGWNYGVVEDAHQTCMHVMAQYLRHGAIAEELLGTRRF
jgi:phosphoheptose isomerase